MKSSLLALAISGGVVTAWTPGQSVQTTSGSIVGQASDWKKEVSEYLGVPFAEPPVGPLRWMPPKALNSPAKVVNATAYSKSCAESASRESRLNPNAPNNIGASEGPQSEDCLYLNIWTKPQAGDQKKAVLAWIYGGGFVVGSANNVVYKGAHLAEEQDVVVVSMNYRLGVLGFPGVALDGPNKNLGLMDQRRAVEWIRDNIEKFGGDSKRITVFGQSAGGASVDFMSYAYTKDPIVAGFIPQSGTASLSTNTGSGSTQAVAGWSALSKAVGCGEVTEQDVKKTLSCMQGKPTNAILDATATPPGGSALGGWGPKVDEQTVFSDTATRRAKGQFVHKPILVGNVNNEGATFAKGSGASANTIFGCPSGQAAKARRDAGVPAWRYQYEGEWPNQPLGKAFAGAKGAWHGSELALLFGTTELKDKGPDTPAEKQLAKKMRDAWAGFAKDPEKGLEKLGWPLYDTTKESVVILGGPNDSTIRFESPAKLDSGCSTTSPNAAVSTMATISTAQPIPSPAAPAPVMMGGHSHGM